jgi:predicted transcriptional regulator of viral defense system
LSVTKFLESIEASGQRYFLTKEIEKNTGQSKEAISVALSRLKSRGKVHMIRQGFGLICTQGRAPDPSFYLDPMMSFMSQKYYVGLLAASAHWGASHQASMSYQILSSSAIRDTKFSKGRLEFIHRKDFPCSGYIREPGVGGYLLVSTPELTSVDLIRYYKRCGFLSNVATVLDDLVEKWDGRKASKIFNQPFVSTTSLQRLGYILDVVLGHTTEAKYVEKAILARRPVAVYLDPSDSSKISESVLNPKWSILVNCDVEPD